MGPGGYLMSSARTSRLTSAVRPRGRDGPHLRGSIHWSKAHPDWPLSWQLELTLLRVAMPVGPWRGAAHRRLDCMARHAPVGRPSARRDELSDHAWVEPCPADTAARECRRRYPLQHPADPARPAIPRERVGRP